MDNDESSLCSQLQKSPEVVQRPHKRNLAHVYKTQLDLPTRDGKRPRSSTPTPSSISAQAATQADVVASTSLHHASSSSSTLQLSVDQDEPTDAEVDEVCETKPSATWKSVRKRVATERACEHMLSKQTALSVVDGTFFH
jgi:hypothetical protein